MSIVKGREIEQTMRQIEVSGKLSAKENGIRSSDIKLTSINASTGSTVRAAWLPT